MISSPGAARARCTCGHARADPRSAGVLLASSAPAPRAVTGARVGGAVGSYVYRYVYHRFPGTHHVGAPEVRVEAHAAAEDPKPAPRGPVPPHRRSRDAGATLSPTCTRDPCTASPQRGTTLHSRYRHCCSHGGVSPTAQSTSRSPPSLQLVTPARAHSTASRRARACMHARVHVRAHACARTRRARAAENSRESVMIN